IGGGDLSSLDYAVDIVMRDVEKAVIFRTGGGSFFVFVLEMKRVPNSPVAFAIAEQRNFLRRDEGNAQGIEQKNQLFVFLAVDECIEETRPWRRIEVGQGAQFPIVAQLVAQQLLIIAIVSAGFRGLRAATAHFRIW